MKMSSPARWLLKSSLLLSGNARAQILRDGRRKNDWTSRINRVIVKKSDHRTNVFADNGILVQKAGTQSQWLEQ